MPDITMCKGDGCHMAKTCYRCIATPDEHWQSYFVRPPIQGKKCNHYWRADPEDLKDKYEYGDKDILTDDDFKPENIKKVKKDD